MAQSVCVTFSGPALAFLLYENVKTRHEQEGFLLGDTNIVVKKTITDSVGHNVVLEKIVTVNAVIPCPQTNLFYDNIGRINQSKLKAILGGQENSVVAWFKYRRNSNFKLSFREKIIHKELMEYFPIDPDLFSVCLLSSSCSNSMSTHTYNHKLLRYYRRSFQTIPIRINNLGEPYNSYKAPVNCSRSFLRLYESVHDNHGENNDLNIITEIQKTLQKATNNIINNNLINSEKKLAQLQQEVERLRLEVTIKRYIKENTSEPVVLDNGLVNEPFERPYLIIDEDGCHLSNDPNLLQLKEIDSNSDQSISPSTIANETPLIDLTISSEEEDLDVSTENNKKIPTYSQVLNSLKTKEKNT